MSARRPIFPSGVQRLGGHVAVQCGRDRVDCTSFYQVSYVSRGGDNSWQSSKIPNIDRTLASARTLAEFVGGQLLEHPPSEAAFVNAEIRR